MTFKLSLQINLTPDTELNGIIFQQYTNVYNQESIEYLTYKIKLNFYQFYHINRKLLHSICPKY